MSPECRLTRLSLVNIILFLGTTKKYFCRNSNLQNICDTIMPLLINATYTNFTKKLPDKCNAQTKTSISSCKFRSYKELTILCESLWFKPTKFQRKEIFSGNELSTGATEFYFLLTILNNAGNLSFRGLFLI